MQKLQELIMKHKEKLLYGREGLTIYHTRGTIIIDGFNNGEPFTAFSLSDLLFSTEFLSLLEWKKQYEIWSHSPEIITRGYLDGCSEIQHSKKIDSEGDYRYHKINLALLESDKERVDYISNFTL